MKNTGQILREAREKKGISIAEVSLATKINSKILTAMEQGNVAKLPPKTFLRGFVTSYAAFLGLDVDQIQKMFLEEMGTTRPSVEAPEASLTSAPTTQKRTPDVGARSNSSFAKVGAVVGIIVLVIVIILLKKKMDSYESETVPKPVETVVATPTPEPATTELDQLKEDSTETSATPIAQETATPTPKVVPSATPKPVATATPKPVATPTPTLKPTATPKPIATPTPKPTLPPKASPSPTATPAAATSPTPKPTPKAGGPTKDVTIEALNDVDITATIDGEVQNIHLKADQVQTIKARRKVSLQLSDGGAVSIIVNGIDRGVPGDLGKPKKVDIP